MASVFGEHFQRREIECRSMASSFIAAAAIANIVLTAWAVRQTLKNQHSLNAFASKLRWAMVFFGASWFFLALHFLDTGLFGVYVAFAGGLSAGFFLFFPDAAYYLGRSIASLQDNSPKSS